MTGEVRGPHVFGVERAVDRILEVTAGEVRIGLPLGLGKPNQLINALYRRARQDDGIRLEIYTALSLGRPKAGSELERRFLEPFAERVFGDYAELDYLLDLRAGRIPPNVRVCEFFFQPGSMLGRRDAQLNHISCNYTHAARDINGRGVNVVAQLVAPHADRDDRVSLSCNPEVTLDLLPLLQARRAQGERILIVGQLHRELPYMFNDAEVAADSFDILVDEPGLDTRLFSTPNMPVNVQDHFIGLHVSPLVRDGGLIQIGIGALGDALVHHVLMRHHDNDLYNALLAEAGIASRFPEAVAGVGGTGIFSRGLYGCSEMVTAGLLGLLDGGVIHRPVLDDPDLMRLLESGRIGEEISLHTLDVLLEEGVLNRRLDRRSLGWLQAQGILPAEVDLRDDRLVLPDGATVVNDIEDRVAREALKPLLGTCLRTTLLHGGFFLGPGAFYRRLRGMSEEERRRINMTRISFVNGLHGDERLKRLQRRHARFVNTAFTATLMGTAVSDQLEDGQVLSGVGGQYNFVAQAHELEGARSILMLRAWRERGGRAMSNIVWSYGHATIPRHLRDIFVTEYGIADLRGKTDAECIAAMLNIADSRFQETLLDAARQAGKIAVDHRIPEQHRYNAPERLEDVRGRHPAQFPRFPLGTDFDRVEQELLQALEWLRRSLGERDYLRLGRGAVAEGDAQARRYAPHLARMGLDRAEGIRNRLYRRLVLAGLAATMGASAGEVENG